ncbi:beta-N-acetylhexosaminidase [Chitinophaga nivalis]|uniref:beta-N-acetylhexosaminidase n=1 Tax=Chitinophaga nivalis TaxID=2991709 RepID=A0ABT3IIE7_9BACT|nr:beta-N-acetylhexosaminidase [Chitinophaga nivalis]MCW3466566.1 beta-N-acetylhexosaminidase [Chitinophaga nivalis]MCW3483743.1 beta-N-acetylhexosaminidase [Chitinophaga nivalis]
MQKLHSLLSGGLLLLLTVTTLRLQAIHLIPQPSAVKTLPGRFNLSGATVIIAGNNTTAATLLQQTLRADHQLSLSVKTAARHNYIRLTTDAGLLKTIGTEGYLLQVQPDHIRITAASNTGIFYGIQSLRQLIMPQEQAYAIDAVEITDKPRFSWRAFMLDEGRYFKGPAAVKRLLDEMALLKMNVFHWHLTDDQGWRIEIKKYPLLTQVGSKRDSTQTGGWNSPTYDGKPHAGYYTQEEIRDIIRYAADRHITIVPEIEMPGHASAAIAAYPWLGTRHQPITVPVKFGVQYDVFNVADPKVIGFLQDVLQEVMALFPSKVIHIGGDEVKYDQWKADAGVNAYMQAHQLRTPADLQIAFTNRISNYLAGKQRRMAGWNEIMGHKLHEYTDTADVSAKEKLAAGTIVQFWKGELQLITEAVAKGYEVINSYHAMTYLDYSYEEISLEKAFRFDPVPTGLDPKYQAKILGSGCQMWGEWIPDEKAMQHQVYPRLAAYANSDWAEPANKDFENFKSALTYFLQRWKTAQ